MNDQQQSQAFDTHFEQSDTPHSDAGVTYGREDRSWIDAAPEGLANDAGMGRGEGDLGATVLSALRLDAMLDARRIHTVAQPDGAVILMGEVKDASDRALAGLIARRQPGVTRIENRLDVETAIHEGSIWPHGVDHVETTSERFAGLRKAD
jgi:hypothetical protein